MFSGNDDSGEGRTGRKGRKGRKDRKRRKDCKGRYGLESGKLNGNAMIAQLHFPFTLLTPQPSQRHTITSNHDD